MFTDLLDKIKDFFSDLKDRVLDFYEENKKLSYIIAGLIVLILICLILLIAIAGKKDKKSDEVPGSSLVLTEPLIIPNGPELPRDYNTSRTTKEKWTDEEAQPWFTIPGEKEIDALSKSNDNLINEVIGAAP